MSYSPSLFHGGYQARNAQNADQEKGNDRFNQPFQTDPSKLHLSLIKLAAVVIRNFEMEQALTTRREKAFPYALYDTPRATNQLILTALKKAVDEKDEESIINTLINHRPSGLLMDIINNAGLLERVHNRIPQQDRHSLKL